MATYFALFIGVFYIEREERVHTVIDLLKSK
jgi:hypothetical protein